MTPLIGAGTLIKYGAAGASHGGSFTLLGQVADVNPPKSQIAKVSNSAFDSPTNTAGLPVEQILMGWESPGDMQMKVRYDSGGTQHAAIAALKGLLKAFEITKTDGKGYVYPGYITEFGEELPLKDTCMTDITISLSGPAVAF